MNALAQARNLCPFAFSDSVQSFDVLVMLQTLGIDFPVSSGIPRCEAEVLVDIAIKL
jgi:hypothetical protein